MLFFSVTSSCHLLLLKNNFLFRVDTISIFMVRLNSNYNRLCIIIPKAFNELSIYSFFIINLKKINNLLSYSSYPLYICKIRPEVKICNYVKTDKHWLKKNNRLKIILVLQSQILFIIFDICFVKILLICLKIKTVFLFFDI